MQTLSEIRELLQAAGLKPRRQLGQSFLVDKNLLAKLLELAELTGRETVLEVGSATGSLTEELLAGAARVVAVEIDRGLGELLRQRLGGEKRLVLIHGDVLASKHAISAAVLEALGRRAVLVANLPYNIATPLVAQCLMDSWRAAAGPCRRSVCRFDRLTFTVQREVFDRMRAGPGEAPYGSISVLVGLLGRVRLGPVVPALAFWPRPKVAGRIMRIDFDPAAAGRVADVEALRAVVQLAFRHRRKQIGSMLRLKQAAFPAEALREALSAADIDLRLRPEQVPPESFAALANALAGR